MAVFILCGVEELVFLPFCYPLLADTGQRAEQAPGLPPVWLLRVCDAL